ncbi:antitoxin [Desulfococcus sp.]|uniref:antitoxin n=1 Tax=Desulfococcus sp. TaxID=2025834 RepID=UPI00359419F8
MKFHDPEERELMESIETEEWVSIDDLEEEIQKAKQAARATLAKSERMNIRISPNDLRRLKLKAMQEGMPYQTLVSSIIHKYVMGRLEEKREYRESQFEKR